MCAVSPAPAMPQFCFLVARISPQVTTEDWGSAVEGHPVNWPRSCGINLVHWGSRRLFPVSLSCSSFSVISSDSNNASEEMFVYLLLLLFWIFLGSVGNSICFFYPTGWPNDYFHHRYLGFQGKHSNFCSNSEHVGSREHCATTLKMHRFFRYSCWVYKAWLNCIYRVFWRKWSWWLWSWVAVTRFF